VLQAGRRRCAPPRLGSGLGWVLWALGVLLALIAPAGPRSIRSGWAETAGTPPASDEELRQLPPGWSPEWPVMGFVGMTLSIGYPVLKLTAPEATFVHPASGIGIGFGMLEFSALLGLSAGDELLRSVTAQALPVWVQWTLPFAPRVELSESSTEIRRYVEYGGAVYARLSCAALPLPMVGMGSTPWTVTSRAVIGIQRVVSSPAFGLGVEAGVEDHWSLRHDEHLRSPYVALGLHAPIGWIGGSIEPPIPKPSAP